MPIQRRVLLGLTAAAPLMLAGGRLRAAEDPRFTERTLGSPNAPIKVMEFFSLTCTHCAAFAQETMPEVKEKLIAPGKVQWIFRDFPLDRVALWAAMAARSLPPERYEPFIEALFASQDRWAFRRDIDPREELAKMAALAGLSRQAFDAALNDQELEKFILTGQQKAEDEYHVDSTPTFITQDGRKHAGELPFRAFAQFLGVDVS